MTKDSRPELVWNGVFQDVLSGGFVAKTDSYERVHRLSRLCMAAWDKGQELEPSEEFRQIAGGMGKLVAVEYQPSWGGGSSATAIARIDARVPSFGFAAGLILCPPEGSEAPELVIGFDPEAEKLSGDVEVAPLSLARTGVTRLDGISYDLSRRAFNFYDQIQAQA